MKTSMTFMDVWPERVSNPSNIPVANNSTNSQEDYAVKKCIQCGSVSNAGLDCQMCRDTLCEQDELPSTHKACWDGPTHHQIVDAKSLTPMKAIRRKCLDCAGGSVQEVRMCAIPSCALYPYRFGKRPKYHGNTSKVVSAEQQAAIANRMAKVRDGNRS